MPRMDRHAQQSALRVWSIPVQAVSPNPHQPRRAFDSESLDALAASIRQLGLLQPISVRSLEGSRYELIAGERRLRACKQLGMTHIDALVVSVSENSSALLALVENLQREDLHFLDEAEGYAAVLRECAMTQEALAERIGGSQSAIANKIRLLRLESAVRAFLRASSLTERHARALLQLPSASLQMEAAHKMAEQGLTVVQGEGLITQMLNAAPEEKNHGCRRVISLIRDHRLYINAIRDITRQMDSAGLDADMEIIEKEACVEVVVRISKKRRTPRMERRRSFPAP